jgi:hypothetical protein
MRRWIHHAPVPAWITEAQPRASAAAKLPRSTGGPGKKVPAISAPRATPASPIGPRSSAAASPTPAAGRNIGISVGGIQNTPGC